jgi:hypothetical protein
VSHFITVGTLGHLTQKQDDPLKAGLWSSHFTVVYIHFVITIRNHSENGYFIYLNQTVHNKWPKQVLKWVTPGRKKTGKPRVGPMKGIQNALAQKEVEDGQWMDRRMAPGNLKMSTH